MVTSLRHRYRRKCKCTSLIQLLYVKSQPPVLTKGIDSNNANKNLQKTVTSNDTKTTHLLHLTFYQFLSIWILVKIILNVPESIWWTSFLSLLQIRKLCYRVHKIPSLHKTTCLNTNTSPHPTFKIHFNIILLCMGFKTCPCPFGFLTVIICILLIQKEETVW